MFVLDSNNIIHSKNVIHFPMNWGMCHIPKYCGVFFPFDFIPQQRRNYFCSCSGSRLHFHCITRIFSYWVTQCGKGELGRLDDELRPNWPFVLFWPRGDLSQLKSRQWVGSRCTRESFHQIVSQVWGSLVAFHLSVECTQHGSFSQLEAFSCWQMVRHSFFFPEEWFHWDSSSPSIFQFNVGIIFFLSKFLLPCVCFFFNKHKQWIVLYDNPIRFILAYVNVLVS